MKAIALSLAFLWSFWGMYVLVMGVYRAHLAGRMTMASKVLSAPYIVLGYAMDVFANLVIASIVFFEPPREFLVTTRLARHIKHPGPDIPWRTTLAAWICDNLLDVFDPSGDHCA